MEIVSSLEMLCNLSLKFCGSSTIQIIRWHRNEHTKRTFSYIYKPSWKGWFVVNIAVRRIEWRSVTAIGLLPAFAQLSSVDCFWRALSRLARCVHGLNLARTRNFWLVETLFVVKENFTRVICIFCGDYPRCSQMLCNPLHLLFSSQSNFNHGCYKAPKNIFCTEFIVTSPLPQHFYLVQYEILYRI
jgi:hypothetical protein